MAQLSVLIDEEMYQWLRSRVTADVTISSQTNEALEAYRERKEREAQKIAAKA